jgi:hypothetical protein
MSEVRLVPRFLALPVLALLIAGCAANNDSTPDTKPVTLRGNPCATGKAKVSKQEPIVCVDDSARTLVVFPDPVVVHNVKESDRTTPVTVQWLTRSGTGDVQVQIEPGCVDKKSCDGRGKCSAETVPGARKKCKYDVWITGGRHDRLDPTLDVNGCCD